jgi:orotate phosphoribosyltransferase
MNYKQQFIEFMVRSGVLSFGSFKTKSGRVAPYFVNTGNYKTGEQIAKLGDYYAQCIEENLKNDFNVIFGPAYKGIPLSVTASISLYRKFALNFPYCFNRKEKKDHGEGGNIIGYPLKNGDRILIVEDVITAGTSVRESIPLLKSIADVQITSLVISVDRMEKGIGEKTTLQELIDEFGIKVKAIVTIEEILYYLFNKEIDGKVLVDKAMKVEIEDYLRNSGC